MHLKIDTRRKIWRPCNFIKKENPQNPRRGLLNQFFNAMQKLWIFDIMFNSTIQAPKRSNMKIRTPYARREKKDQLIDK